MAYNDPASRTLNFVQLIVEACVAAGFFVGLLPFAYLWSSGWVVPLTIISLILALINKNGTAGFAAANFFIAIISFIPLLGFVFRLIGILISLFNINVIRIHLK